MSSYTEQDSVRIMPEIYSTEMPEPIASRYKFGKDGIRLPCDDRKVADSVICQGYHVYCTSLDQMIDFTLQGSGEIFKI